MRRDFATRLLDYYYNSNTEELVRDEGTQTVQTGNYSHNLLHLRQLSQLQHLQHLSTPREALLTYRFLLMSIAAFYVLWHCIIRVDLDHMFKDIVQLRHIEFILRKFYEDNQCDKFPYLCQSE